MRVIVIDKGQMDLREVENVELATLQTIVGGYIEVVFTARSWCRPGHMLTGYCNDSGSINGLEPNVMCYPHGEPICGPIVITALDPETDDCEPVEAEMHQLVVMAVDGCVPFLHVAERPRTHVMAVQTAERDERTGMWRYECPGCESPRELTPDRWNKGPTLKCLVCGAVYTIVPSVAVDPYPERI